MKVKPGAIMSKYYACGVRGHKVIAKATGDFRESAVANLYDLNPPGDYYLSSGKCWKYYFRRILWLIKAPHWRRDWIFTDDD